MSRLSATDLSCRRGHLTLFSGLSFSVEAGQALMVAGANGSGKTSLLRLLAGLALPAEGTLYWDGEPARTRALQYRSRLLYLGHTVPIRDELTVLENLSSQLELDGIRAGRTEQLEALRRVGLAERHGLAARGLSLGQRRRLGLARLPLARRPLWLLDEPLTGLDAAGAGWFRELVDRHLAEGGMAAITSHQPLALAREIVPLVLS